MANKCLLGSNKYMYCYKKFALKIQALICVSPQGSFKQPFLRNTRFFLHTTCSKAQLYTTVYSEYVPSHNTGIFLKKNMLQVTTKIVTTKIVTYLLKPLPLDEMESKYCIKPS